MADSVPLLRKLTSGTLVSIATVLHLVAANLMAPKLNEMGFATLACERAQLRRIADKFGVRQRSMMFAIVMHALNQGEGGLGMDKISAAYTGLEDDRTKKGDDYFRVRTLRTHFAFSPDFETFVRHVDKKIDEIEARDNSRETHALKHDDEDAPLPGALHALLVHRPVLPLFGQDGHRSDPGAAAPGGRPI